MARPQRLVRPEFDPLPGPRQRTVAQQWPRDPKGAILPTPPPPGIRAPNGLIWGHKLDDFMWLQRVPGVNCMTIWSRSMVEELGERGVVRFVGEENEPRVVRPWPVLCLPAEDTTETDPALGLIDAGCAHGHLGAARRMYVLRADMCFGAADARAYDVAQRRPICASDEANTVPNDAGVFSPLGVPYARLWCQVARENFVAVRKIGVSLGTVLLGHDETTGLARAVDEVGMTDVWVDGQISDEAAGIVVLIGIHPDELVKKAKKPTRSTQEEHEPAAAIDVDASAKSGPATAVDVREGEGAGSRGSGCSLDTASGELRAVAQSHGGSATEVVQILPDAEAGTAADYDSPPPRGAETAPNTEGEREDSKASKGDATEAQPTARSGNIIASGVISPSSSTPDAATSQSDAKKKAKKAKNKKNKGKKGKGKGKGTQEPEKVPEPEPQDPYSVKDLPKLEEFIPEQFFPDYLEVHRSYRVDSQTKFKRIFPVLERDTDLELDGGLSRIAHIYLSEDNRLGTGNHSIVRRAPLTLPAPLFAGSRTGQVTVAVKSAFARVSARKFLRNEAATYAAFPQHLQEEYCGFNLVAPIKHPVPVGPVVPKFYGYYVPVGADGEAQDERLSEYSFEDDTSLDSASPLLLMEECGGPIDPATFTLDMRSECYSLILRLHHAGFLQGSMYVRNVVVQPGPLSLPPAGRSLAQPSFRIIDFGRAEQLEDTVRDGASGGRAKKERRRWMDWASDEEARAQRALAIPEWDF